MSSEKERIAELDRYLEDNRERMLEDFFTYLRFPSVSSEKTFGASVEECSAWVEDHLGGMGLDVQRWPTAGYPVIFGSKLTEREDAPTVLIYGHYDVQPVDPLDLWETPPFEPSLRDGTIFARGAQDNKGQSFFVFEAVRHLLAVTELPVNVKVIIEGEEEIGSPNLPPLLAQKKQELEADYLLIVDVGFRSLKAPAVSLGARGILTMNVHMTGAKSDLHSGTFGGIAFNPNHALIEVLGKARDDRGRIAIPGFYEDVEDVDERFRAQLRFDLTPEEFEKEFGVYPSGGEQSYSPAESCWIRPTLEVNGISGGYTGDGFKTVIPAKAFAKVSCRLVPNQKPEKIGRLVRDFFLDNTPEGIRTEVTLLPGWGEAVRAHPSSKLIRACVESYRQVFDLPCRTMLEGGSIPISAELAAASGADIAFVGMGLPTDNIHAPNEHFGLDRLETGFKAIVRILEILGAGQE